MKRHKKSALYYVFAALLLAALLLRGGWDRILSAANPAASVFRYDSDFTAVFFDIGQGDAALLACEDTYILIDSGPRENIGVITGFLDQAGIDCLDMVIATHPHADHIGGMDQIIRHVDVGEMVMSGAETTSHAFEDLLCASQEADLGVTVPERGEMRQHGALTLTFLWPEADSPGKDLNEASLVVRVAHEDGGTLLMTGDIGESSETVLTREMPELLACQVLKVAHHGSAESSGAAFLRTVGAHFAVISVGKGNSYGHPGADALTRLADAGMIICRTDESGSLVCRWQDGRPTIEPLEGIGYRNAA